MGKVHIVFLWLPPAMTGWKQITKELAVQLVGSASTPIGGSSSDPQGQDPASLVSKGKRFGSPMPPGLAKVHITAPPPPPTMTAGFTSLLMRPLKLSSAEASSCPSLTPETVPGLETMLNGLVVDKPKTPVVVLTLAELFV